MGELDGVYRHRGTTLTWCAEGLTLEGPDGAAVRLSWVDVRGARRLPDLEGEIRIAIVPSTDRAPSGVLGLTVNSDDDANRLITVVNWCSSVPQDAPRPHRRVRRHGQR